MKVLVTGATGFVGRHVLRELNNTEHEILALNRQQLDFDGVKVLRGNLNDLEAIIPKIIEFQADAVIHLAWEGIPNYSESISKINLNNSINLFDIIISNTTCSKILVSGSCWEYGKKLGVCKESDPVNIDTYFTWTKYSLYQYLSVKCAEKKVNLNWFRIFYVYGPGQKEESLIPTLIKSIGDKKTPSIKTPINKNDFIYVGDVAKALVKTVDTKLPSGVYNLGSGYSTSIYDICQIVNKYMFGTKKILKQVLENGEKNETVNFWANMEKTERALKIKYKTGLEEGIKLYIQSIK